MGSVWLGSLPDVLRNAGVPVNVYPGWETRSRSSGGYDSVLAIQVHHTASDASPASDMRYMWEVSDTKPIGALHLARDGRWTVGAAGATNTSGKGGPLVTSRGTIPLDAANRFVISIEAANRGDGEVWPDAQLRSYVKGSAALARAYLGGVVLVPGDVHAHFEWTSRKIDPAGNSWYAQGANKWNMTQFRSDVTSAIAPPPQPPPDPTPTEGVPDVFYPIQPFRNSDTRGYGGPGVQPGVALEFGINPAVFPADTTAIAMNVAAVGATRAGFVTVWPDGPNPGTSMINFAGDQGAYNGAVVVGVKGGKFKIQTSATCHLICDITGYWTA
jgi:hypothetical protein